MRVTFPKLTMLAAALLITLTGCSAKTSSPSQENSSSQTASNQTTGQVSDPSTAPIPGSTSEPTADSSSNVSPSTTPDTSTPNSTSNAPANSPSSPTSSGSVDMTKQMYSVTAVKFANPNSGWVGGQGFILHTADGGQHWNSQYKGPYTIDDFSFLSPYLGWALAHTGDSKAVILQTKDGGQHWAELSNPTDVKSLHFVSETTGFATNKITIDGGKTWKPIPTPSQLLGTTDFSDAEHGWAVTSDGKSLQIQRTTDGGKTWAKTFSRATAFPAVTASIQATSPDDAWVMIIGGTGMTQTSFSIFHTADGGATWIPVVAHSTAGGGPAPGYDNSNTSPKGPATKPGTFVAVNSQTAMLSGVCPACNEGTVSTGATHDGGKTWVNYGQSLPGQSGLLSFVNTGQGWLITTQYNQPSVLYMTEDGGKNWKQEFVFGPANK